MKIKKTICKTLACVLSMTMLISSYTTTAFAALNVGTNYAVKENDSAYQYISGWGEDGTIASLDERGWSTFKLRSIANTDEPLYCLEFGKAFSSNDATATSIEDVSVYTSLPAVAQDGVKLTSIYGYPNYNYGVSREAAMYATQIISWEYQLGYRVGVGVNNPKQGLYGEDDINNKAYRFYNGIVHKNYQDILAAYTEILTNIATHSVKPSFAMQTSIKLVYNIATGKYEKTLVDINGVLEKYNVSVEGENVTCNVSENTLNLSSITPINGTAKLLFEKKGTCVGSAVALVSEANHQITLYGSMDDPVRGSVVVKTDIPTSATITKTSEDNLISDIEFKVESKELGYESIVKTNTAGIATISGLIVGGTYTATEINVNNKYQEPQTQTFTAHAGQIINLDFENVLKKGVLEINKIDGVTKQPIKGVTFAVYKGDIDLGDVIAVIDTNDSGKAVFENIPFGDYSLQEIFAPGEYIVDETVYSFSISETNQSILYNFENFNATGVIEIQKTNSLPEISLPLAGAMFDVYAAKDIPNTSIRANDKVLSDISTNENGVAETSPLNYGEYYLIETKSPDGLAANFEKKHYIIVNNSKVTAEIYNTPIVIEILKLSQLDKTPIANAVFSITNELGNVVKTVTTNDTGLVKVQGLSYEKYTMHETSTPIGFIPNNTAYSFEIAKNNTENAVPYAIISDILSENKLVIKNTPTQVVLVKTDAVNKNQMSNVSFNLFEGDSTEKIATYTTNYEGKITVNNLKIGVKYSFRESETVDGYYPNNINYDFYINNNGETIFGGNVVENINATNIPTQYKIVKVDSVTNKPIENVGFSIYKADGSFVQTGKTDSSGCLNIDKLNVGSYYFIESIFPVGYIQNSEKEFFEITTPNDIKSKTVKNVPTNVVINKTDKITGKPLLGALIGVYDVGGNEVYRGKTDIKGKVNITNLPVASYTYKEIKQPNGYQLDTTLYDLTLNPDGTVTNNKVIENAPTEVVITKINEDKDPLAGAKIGIYNSDDLLVFEGITNELGELRVFYLENDTYTYKELEAPKGFCLNTEIYEFTIDENGISTTDNIIINTTTNVVIKKVDNEGNPLKNAKIAIRDSKEKVVYEGITDDKGKVSVEGLFPDLYTYVETQAPNGYQLDTEVHSFEILIDGSVKGDNVIVNQPTKVIINKISDDGKLLPGSTIGIFNNENQMIFSNVTDEIGQIVAYNLHTGKYTFKELLPRDGYELNEKEYQFTIDKNGKVHGDNEIENSLTKTVITKTDESGNPLEGSVIGVFNINGSLIDSKITDKTGKVIFLGLKQGQYFYREIEAPNGYEPNENNYYFSINEFGQSVGEFNLVNNLLVKEIPDTGTNMAITTAFSMSLLSIAAAFVIYITLVTKKKQK